MARVHFPQALTNHRHNICVEDNNLPNKQQTKDLLPNSKPKTEQTANQDASKHQTQDRENSKWRCEQIFFSMHKVQSFVRRECDVVQKCDVTAILPTCLPYVKKLDQLWLVCTGSPRHDITVSHEIRIRSPLRPTQLQRYSSF